MNLVKEPQKLKKTRESFKHYGREMKLKLSEHTDDSYWAMVPRLFNSLNNFLWDELGSEKDAEERRPRPIDWA